MAQNEYSPQEGFRRIQQHSDWGYWDVLEGDTDEMKPIYLHYTPTTPTVLCNGQPVGWQAVRVPVYPRSRLKRLWWRIRGIQPTEFVERMQLDTATADGAFVGAHYEVDESLL